MADTLFQELQQLKDSSGAGAVIDRLIDTLRAKKDYHRLFDAQLLRKKQEMGLPLTRPTSFQDVPAERKEEFEKAYVDAAREAGQSLLQEGKLSQAWMYFQAIREPDAVRRMIDSLPVPREPDQETEEIINLAFFQGVNPVKGVELMLRAHGTCSTITALDQQFPQMSTEDRARAAAVMVRSLYEDLTHSVRHDVTQRMPAAPPTTSLHELIFGRDWLFAEGNYHIDCSHLNAVVRFARSLNVGSPECSLARELAEYGSQLAPQFQYAGEPPFEEFYPAHIEYFKILSGTGRDEGLAYFREKLAHAEDDQDRQLIAYVLVDLLMRTDRLGDAVEVARQHLLKIDEQYGFSFAELCQKANRMDALLAAARDKDDLVTYTAALLQSSQ